jgi:3-oxoadipate enol-lactonase
MSEHFIQRGDVTLYARVDGVDDPAAPTVVFANSLGTNLHLWDAVLPLLPEGLRIVRMDKRGHGKSSAPDAPYTMGALISDTEAVCDALNVRDAMFVGLSIGGMIAQGLAVKRLDIIRTLVLSNTAAKIGMPKLWQDRIDTVRAKGLEALVDGIMQKWFTRDFPQFACRDTVARYGLRNLGRGILRVLRCDFGHGLLHAHQRASLPDAGHRGVR